MQRLRLGILGGMGPAATADFYAKLVAATPAARDQDHIPVLMEADPGIPDRGESFLHGGPSPLPWLRRGADALAARGADVIAMPCNTAHLWFDALSEGLKPPLLHIVDAVVEDLVRQLRPARALRVGILGTTATLKGGLYPRRAADRGWGWDWVAPSAQDQQALVQVGIAAVKSGDLATARQRMATAQDGLRAQGVDAVVYACTEVPLALAGHAVTLPVSDSTDALARLAVRTVSPPLSTGAATPSPACGRGRG